MIDNCSTEALEPVLERARTEWGLYIRSDRTKQDRGPAPARNIGVRMARGDLIAFTNQSGGFHVGVMRTDGSGARILTTGWEDEGPTWAPNGRVIMFGRTIQGGRGSQIWSIDVSGRNERRVPTPGDASDPAWSPLIQ